MKQLAVRADFSGSYVVVHDGTQHYIEARKDCRYPDQSFIEHVCGGQVQNKLTVPNEDAPEVIIALTRRYMT